MPITSYLPLISATVFPVGTVLPEDIEAGMAAVRDRLGAAGAGSPAVVAVALDNPVGGNSCRDCMGCIRKAWACCKRLLQSGIGVGRGHPTVVHHNLENKFGFILIIY